MHAELKGLDTADAEGGELVAFCPDDAAHFALGVTASIGPAGEDGAELFYFDVCLPDWFAKQPLPKGFAFQRHALILERWDPQVVERAIRDLCLRTEGDDWVEIASKLSRYGLWEFEDYRPS